MVEFGRGRVWSLASLEQGMFKTCWKCLNFDAGEFGHGRISTWATFDVFGIWRV